MRYTRSEQPKTGISSLATTTGVVVFVTWLVSMAMQHDGLFAHDLTLSPPAVLAAHQAQSEGVSNPG
jgi:hypothetical protein